MYMNTVTHISSFVLIKVGWDTRKFKNDCSNELLSVSKEQYQLSLGVKMPGNFSLSSFYSILTSHRKL